MVHELPGDQPSWPVQALLGRRGRVNAPPAEFSSHLEGGFSAAWADRRGLTQDSSVDINEQVLLGLVLDLDGDVLVAVLINL